MPASSAPVLRSTPNMPPMNITMKISGAARIMPAGMAANSDTALAGYALVAVLFGGRAAKQRVEARVLRDRMVGPGDHEAVLALVLAGADEIRQQNCAGDDQQHHHHRMDDLGVPPRCRRRGGRSHWFDEVGHRNSRRVGRAGSASGTTPADG